MTLMEKLVSLRKEYRFSQEELAEKLGVSRQTISKWERGEASPDLNNAIQLCKIYNISLDEIARCITGEEEPAKRGISLNKDSYKNAAETANAASGEYIRMVLPERESEEIYPQRKSAEKQKKSALANEAAGSFKFDSPSSRSLKMNTGTASPVRSKEEELGKKLMKFPFWALAILIFLFYGGVFDLWEYSWLIFLAIPVYYTMIIAYQKQNMMYFPYPLIVTILYLFFMLAGNSFGSDAEILTIWAFGSIPLYYTAIIAFRRKKCKFFCFPVLTTLMFLSGAVLFDAEMFLWVFALIPFYYIYSSKIDSLIFRRRRKR